MRLRCHVVGEHTTPRGDNANRWYTTRAHCPCGSRYESCIYSGGGERGSMCRCAFDMHRWRTINIFWNWAEGSRCLSTPSLVTATDGPPPPPPLYHKALCTPLPPCVLPHRCQHTSFPIPPPLLNNHQQPPRPASLSRPSSV